jgi:O-antigen ligase
MMNNLKIQKICNYLLYGFVFLIPWQTRYIYKFLTLGGESFEYGKLSFYLSELILLVLIIFSLIYVKQKNIIKKRVSKIMGIIFIFLLVAIISFFGTTNQQLYFYGIIKLMEVIVLYLLITKIKFNYVKLGMAFVGSMFIHSILGIYQFFSQGVWANKYLGIAEQISNQGGVSVLEGGFGRLLRAYGGFSHPNIFGGFLVIAILILIGIYLNQKKKTILFYSILVILFSTLILTFSRSAFLALFSTLFILFIYFIYKKVEVKKFISILLVLVLVSGISFVLFNDFLKTRIQGQERLELKSNAERVILKKQAQSLLKENWFLGVGINNYVFVVHEKNSSLNIWDYQPVHNVYLLILVELGIIGLISYIYLLSYSLWKAFRSNSLNKVILGLIILVIIIINFFDHYFWTYWSGLAITFLIVALINKK